MSEVRKLGANDLQIGEGTVESPGGKTVTEFNASHLPIAYGTANDAVTGMSNVVFSVDEALSSWIDVRAYEVTGDGATDDTTNLQAAITANPGKVIYIPPGFDCLFSNIDITGDNTTLYISRGSSLTTSVGIGDGSGGAPATGSPIDISGDRCLVTGGGKIISPAEWDGTNVSTYWGVINCTGQDFRVSDIELENVPRIGIISSASGDTIIDRVKISAGYPVGQWSGVETVNACIQISPPTSGDGHVSITNCLLRQSVQGVLNGVGYGDNKCSVNIENNKIENTWDHAIYVVSFYSLIINGNTMTSCRSGVAVGHSYNSGQAVVFTNNILFNSDPPHASVIGLSLSIRDVGMAVISNNFLYGQATTGSAMIIVTGVNSGNNPLNVGVRITGNYVVNTDTTGVYHSRGIYVGDSSIMESMSGVLIEGNYVQGMPSEATGLIQVSGPSASFGELTNVSNNTVLMTGTPPAGVNTIDGIFLQYQNRATVESNKILLKVNSSTAVNLPAIYHLNSVNCVFRGNYIYMPTGYGTNINLYGIYWGTGDDYSIVENNICDFTDCSATIYQYDSIPTTGMLWGNIREPDTNPSGSISWANGDGATKTITNANCNGGKNIIFWATNAAAATLMADQGVFIQTDTANTSFVLSTGDASAPANTSTFNYRIY